MWNLTDAPLKTKSFPISSSLLQVSSICYIQYLNKQNHDPPYTSLCQAQNFVGIFKYFIFLLKYFLSLSHPRGIKSCQVVPKVSLTLSPSTNGLFAIALGLVIIKTYQYSNSFLCDFSSSVLSPKLTPNPSLIIHIIPLLKTISGPQLHIKYPVWTGFSRFSTLCFICHPYCNWCYGHTCNSLHHKYFLLFLTLCLSPVVPWAFNTLISFPPIECLHSL